MTEQLSSRRSSDIARDLRTKAAMIRIGEHIHPFSECDLMEEAAQALEDWLEQSKRECEAVRDLHRELAYARHCGA